MKKKSKKSPNKKKTKKNAESKVYDVLIAGGGPAGLSAALWLARYRHSVVLIDSGDPRNWQTRGINGFLGHPSIRPAELRGLGRDECRRHGVELVDAAIERAERISDDHFVAELKSGEKFSGKRLLLAIGIRDVWPDIPGLDRCYGETAHVCPDCDGYEVVGCKVLVVGNGRKAAGMALSLTTWTNQIVISTNGEESRITAPDLAKLDALEIPVLSAPIQGVHSVDGNLAWVLMGEGMQLDCERLFFAISQYPADDLGEQLGCKRDERGQIIVDDAHHTSVHNVFAAGDITPGPQLAMVAAADGAVAALAIHKSLVPDERKLG